MRRARFNWQLPREIEARLGESTYGSQRAIYEADHLLIILHAPPAPNEKERRPQVFLRKPDGSMLWNGHPNGEAKLKGLVASYREIFEKHEQVYEQADSAGQLFEVLEHLAPVNRSAANMRNALQAARDLARQDSLLIAMRDEAYEISRNLELLLTEAEHAVNHRIAQSAESHAVKAEELALAQHKLNVLAAMTLPIMAVTAIFGMNLISGLENRPQWVFWLVFLIGMAIGLVTKQLVSPQHGSPWSSERGG